MTFIDKFNYLLNKVGVDKVLHRLVGDKVTLIALLTAYVLSDGAVKAMIWTDIIIGIVLLIVSIVKENIDAVADYKDMAWAMAGWVIVSGYFWILWAVAL